MAGLSKEEIIMTSNDNAITLTTHRVLQKTSELNKEIIMNKIKSVNGRLLLVAMIATQLGWVSPVFAVGNNDVESAQIEAEEAQSDVDAVRADGTEVKKRLEAVNFTR